MKKLLFSIVVLASVMASAELVVHKEGSKVVLADSCSNAQDMIQSLSQWTQNVKAGKGCSNLEPMTKSGSDCRYDISSCVPEHVVKYQDAKPEVDGPNCWNLSLVMSGILPSLRYSSPEEMHFYMRPPLCKALKDGEARQPGDVGAIRTVSRAGVEESHGFIYISEKIAYSKNGFSQMSPYALQTMEEVMQTYDVPNKKECRKNQIDLKSDCRNAVSFYRCDSLDSYMDKHKEIPEKVRTTLKKISSAEDCISKQAFSGKSLSAEARKNISDTSKAILAFAEEAKNSPEFNKLPKEQKNFLLGGIFYRLDAIGDQLSFSGEGSLAWETKGLTEMFGNVASKLVKEGK
ncbi:hypothetical protein [Bdellovibrio sp. NC01]|uniref:hypothetical protein n=1 Tax=Bdellovibrio sp. NC01 TaxID=2220073 RepID=UPI0011571023|nr:hypothetical protein [Bdellovibrio sp. NC01]